MPNRVYKIGKLVSISTNDGTIHFQNADLVTNANGDHLFIRNNNPIKQMNMTEKDFEKIVGEGKKIVAWSVDWCPKCKKLHQKRKEKDVIFINCDQNVVLATKHGIKLLPTVDIYEKGRRIQRYESEIPKQILENPQCPFKSYEQFKKKVSKLITPEREILRVPKSCKPLIEKHCEVTVLGWSRGSKKQYRCPRIPLLAGKHPVVHAREYAKHIDVHQDIYDPRTVEGAIKHIIKDELEL